MAILGRRSGKTTIAIERLINSCWSNPKPKEWPLAYIAPTYKQAKRIAWRRFQTHFNRGEVKFNQSELTIEHLPTGCLIYLLGCDTNADTIRGIGLWDAVVDEFKDISKQFIQEVLRPCFSDTGGGCLFIGTPPRVKGISYEYWKRGREPGYPDWISWNVSSADAGLIPAEEIRIAKAELDPDVFNREYGAAFEFMQGLVVKHWSSENIQPVEFRHDSRLHISCDFNVDPCMWIVAQRFPPQYHIIDEIVRENTSVSEMVDEFERRYPPEDVAGITINGDASGDNRSVTADKHNQTAYIAMRNRLFQLGYRDVKVAVRERNPSPLDRVDAFNAKVMNADGQVNLMVSPRCKWLIYNCENLAWIEGSSEIWEPTSRQIEKDRQLKFLKHIFDAASYLVEYYDPIKLIQTPEHSGPKVVTERYKPTRRW